MRFKRLVEILLRSVPAFAAPCHQKQSCKVLVSPDDQVTNAFCGLPPRKSQLIKHALYVLIYTVNAEKTRAECKNSYICIPITVVWQQRDHSCNTRAKSSCSPENVGKQGYVVDHGFLMIRENNIPFQICVNPVQRSEATKKEQRPPQDQ